MEVVEKKQNIIKKKKGLTSKRQILLALFIFAVAAFLMVSPQLFKHSLILGNDVMFHFNRYFEAYKQIQTGQFNFIQSIFSFDQSGRIINALYGPDFAYLQGLLMFATKNWFRYQLLTSFLCFFIAGGAMFSLARRAQLKYELTIFVSLLYMSSTMISYYALSQNMTSWGAAFAPFIYLPAIRAIKDPEKPIKPIELALAVTSLGFIHNLTLFIGILSSAPFYVVGFLKTKKKKKMIINFSLAVLITILLNINTLIGFIDVYFSNQLVSPWLFDEMLENTVRFSTGDNEWGELGLIFSSIMLFQIIYLFSNWKKSSTLEKLFTVIGGFFLLVSSNFLPWDDIPQNFEFFQVIQFPRRFALVSYIFLLIAFVFSLEKLTKNFNQSKKKVMTSCLWVISFLMISNVSLDILQKAEAWESDNPLSPGNNEEWLLTEDPDEIRQGFTSGRYEDVFKIISKATPDYLPFPEEMTQEELVEQSGYQMYNKQIIHNELDVDKSVDQNNRLTLTWDSNGEEESILPVIVYSRSSVLFNGQSYEASEINKTNIGAPILNSQKGTNELTVGYKPLVNVGLLLSIKLVTAAIILFVVLLQPLKRIFGESKENINKK
ncbi:MAG: hypothetical protein L0L22_15110 [Staphylococcus equorum]|nr:hypothetical protein [Staphylococcus equorum]